MYERLWTSRRELNLYLTEINNIHFKSLDIVKMESFLIQMKKNAL